MNASILVAEDDDSQRELVVRRLTAAGHVVTEAVDGPEAIARLAAAHFDVLVTDLWMPGQNGLLVVASAKESSPEVEVVVLTADSSLETTVKCLRAGAFDVLVKPCVDAEFLSTVQRAAEHSRLRAVRALYEASQAIFSARDRGGVAERVVRVAQSAMNADTASLMLPDEHGTFYVADSVGPLERVMEERVPPGERSYGRVARERAPVVLQDGDGRSSIVFPLLSTDRLVGVLNLSRRPGMRPFRQGDLHYVGILAAQIVLALENSFLVQNLLASERLAAIGQVASGIAHEVNNPITFVTGGISHLREGLQNLRVLGNEIEEGSGIETIQERWRVLGGPGMVEELFQTLADVEEGATRIRDIVRDMREMNAASGVPPARLDLYDAVRSAVRVSGVEVRQHATIHLALASDASVLGHAGRLSQVVANLLINAGQAIATTGRPGTIQVRGWTDEDKVFVEVRDDGPGIPQDNLKRIFDTFFTTKKSGNGLGLSISRKIVRLHGGELLVESFPGGGAAFTIVLPRWTKEMDRTLPRDSRPRILVVDDDPAIRRLFRRTLEHDYDVTLASGGLEALRFLKDESEYDLVLCDLMMPDLTGMALYRQIERDGHSALGRFLFATGSLGNEDVQSFLNATGCPVVEKPFDSQELARVVRSRVMSSADVGL